jgi:DedD protein
MDLSLKQRLLGAAVLIALAVLFIPMFMSGSAPQKSAEMETSSLAIPPAPDREFQTRVLPVAPAANAPAGAAPVDEGHIATVDTATAPKPVEPPPVAATPAPAPATPVAKPTPAPAAAPPPAPSTAPESPKPVPGQAADGKYFVHLGVYTATKNADELVATLKKGGYPAFAESSSYQGKPASRVRVGPFADRSAAEAARLRIKQVKPAVPGSVVQLATDAAADATPAALPKNRAGGFAVQLGAMKAVEDANKLRDRVKNAGYAAFVDKVDSNGVTLWRVRVGPEVDRAAADKLKIALKDKLKLDGMIVTL